MFIPFVYVLKLNRYKKLLFFWALSVNLLLLLLLFIVFALCVELFCGTRYENAWKYKPCAVRMCLQENCHQCALIVILCRMYSMLYLMNIFAPAFFWSLSSVCRIYRFCAVFWWNRAITLITGLSWFKNLLFRELFKYFIKRKKNIFLLIDSVSNFCYIRVKTT